MLAEPRDLHVRVCAVQGVAMVTIGRLELMWRSGSWCRPGEWVFGRQFCPYGCIVLDCGFFVFTWHRGAHVDGYAGMCGECGNDHGGHSLDCPELARQEAIQEETRR